MWGFEYPRGHQSGEPMKESLYDYFKRTCPDFIEYGPIDLTPNKDVEKFLEEKYKSQEEAKKCKMIFK